MRREGEQESSRTPRRMRLAGAVSALALVAAVGGGTAWAGAAHGHHKTHGRHSHPGQYVITSTSQISPGVIGALAGRQGAAGSDGHTGPTGPTGATGPQGPGAVEYTYNSTAPDSSEQNTPLGPAGPFSQLTASCVVQSGVVSVVLGSTNKLDVDYDETRLQVENGSPAPDAFTSQTQAASATPADLLGVGNDNNLGDSYSQATLTVTFPVHGVLDVFEHVSYGSNTCHLSVVWTPAG